MFFQDGVDCTLEFGLLQDDLGEWGESFFTGYAGAGFALRSTRFMILPWCSPTIPVWGSEVKSRTVAECQ